MSNVLVWIAAAGWVLVAIGLLFMLGGQSGAINMVVGCGIGAVLFTILAAAERVFR